MFKIKNKRKESCPYCGDAPINHTFSYISSSISMFLDPFFDRTSKWIPEFAVYGAESVLKIIFNILLFTRIIRLSEDQDKVVTLRSKVAWEEAKKRKIDMRQVMVFGKPTDNFRVRLNDKYIYINSLPIPPLPFSFQNKWDDKFFLKEKFFMENIPIPKCFEVPISKTAREKLFKEFNKPLIVKPRVGSRGRHTTTNIRTFEEFEKAVRLAHIICPRVVMEEHLEGYVCRATCVNGKLVGFYRAESAKITGDGINTIIELIAKKNLERPERIEKIVLGKELRDYIFRSGFKEEDILPKGKEINLSHRTGRLFGGVTREMLDELDPSFIPILEKAARTTKLFLIGFDCIIPNPEKSENSQHWGIIEGNTLPFIDLHYYALSGEPKNIAGLIWDFWKK